MLVLFPKYISCLLWPTQYLAACSNGSCLTLNPSLADCRLNTNVQVNNMTVPHHIHADTHIYITSISLFILFFTFPPLSLAGWLPRTLPVGHSKTPNFLYQKGYKKLQNFTLISNLLNNAKTVVNKKLGKIDFFTFSSVNKRFWLFLFVHFLKSFQQI